MNLTIKKIGETALEVSRHFKASPERVFDAHTDAEILSKWLLGPEGWSMPECSSDARPGGKLRYTWVDESGNGFSLNGTYDVVDRPNLIVHRESFESDPPMPDTHVETRFEPSDIGTKVTLLLTFPSQEAREEMIESGMSDGMETSYNRLAEVL